MQQHIILLSLNLEINHAFSHGRAVNYVDSDWSIEILGFIIEILEIDVWENFFLPNC